MRKKTWLAAIVIPALFLLATSALAQRTVRTRSSGRVPKGISTFSRHVPQSRTSTRTPRESIKSRQSPSLRSPATRVKRPVPTTHRVEPVKKSRSPVENRVHVKPQDHHRRHEPHRPVPRDPYIHPKRHHPEPHHPKRHHHKKPDHRTSIWYDWGDWGISYFDDDFSIRLNVGSPSYSYWGDACGSDSWYWNTSLYNGDCEYVYTSTPGVTYVRKLWIPGHWKYENRRVRYIGHFGRVCYRTVKHKVWVPGYWKVY